MTVAELGARMSSSEFAEWMAFAELEPFGPRREDLRSALVSSILVNANRARGSRAYVPEDFLGLTEPVASSPQSVSDKARQFFTALAKDKRA